LTITAKVIAHSVSPDGIEVTSLQLRYPRFIHSEVMTHRVFSRNASSSRAIPVERLIEDIKRDTAMPIHWGKNQPGMQANEECNELVRWTKAPLSQVIGKVSREHAWQMTRDNAIQMAEFFNEAGYHKQIVNRILEPFSHINVICTATEWSNFFDLRLHPDAQPEIHELAKQMKIAMDNSTPDKLQYGDWHLPYITPHEKLEIAVWKEVGTPVMENFIALRYDDLIKMSVARCARTSYLTHDGKEPNKEQDLKLYDRLVGSVPLHASPAEHQARPMLSDEDRRYKSNLSCWVQYRKILEGRI
jgi:thymidylate synthase ThyX